jgi:hypothetical protein
VKALTLPSDTLARGCEYTAGTKQRNIGPVCFPRDRPCKTKNPACTALPEQSGLRQAESSIAPIGRQSFYQRQEVKGSGRTIEATHGLLLQDFVETSKIWP